MGECKKLTQRRSGDDGICLSGDLWALKGKRRQFSDGGEGVRKKAVSGEAMDAQKRGHCREGKLRTSQARKGSNIFKYLLPILGIQTRLFIWL